MNVAIRNVEVPQESSGQSAAATMRKKVVVCTKDFEPGDLIYKVDINLHLPTLSLDFSCKIIGGTHRHCS